MVANKNLPIAFHADRMPLIVVQVVAGLHIHAQRSISCLILKLQLLATDNAKFDVVRWSLGMEQHCVLNRCPELKVNVA